MEADVQYRRTPFSMSLVKNVSADFLAKPMVKMVIPFIKKPPDRLLDYDTLTGISLLGTKRQSVSPVPGPAVLPPRQRVSKITTLP